MKILPYRLIWASTELFKQYVHFNHNVSFRGRLAKYPRRPRPLHPRNPVFCTNRTLSWLFPSHSIKGIDMDCVLCKIQRAGLLRLGWPIILEQAMVACLDVHPLTKPQLARYCNSAIPSYWEYTSARAVKTAVRSLECNRPPHCLVNSP